MENHSIQKNILPLSLLALAFAIHAFHYNYSTDDAFITYRYIHNLLDGNGLVYNAGERVEGYTNFLWAMLVTCPAALGMDVVRVGKMLGLLSGIGALFVTFSIGRSLNLGAHTGNAGRWLALTPVALLTANGAFAMWSLGGLETVFYTFLLSLTTLVYIKSTGGRGMLACGFLFALLIMTRPDGLIFLAAALAHIILGSALGRPNARERMWSDLFRIILAFSMLYLPYFLWRYSYYGYLLPNTFYAKVAGGFGSIPRGLIYLKDFLKEYGVVPVLAAIVFFIVRFRGKNDSETGEKSGRFILSYLIFQLGACAAFILYVGGDQLVMHRFLVPALPAIYLLTAYGLSAAFVAKAEDSEGPIRLKAIALACLVGAVILTCLPSFFGGGHHRVFNVEKPADADRRIVGEWLRDNFDNETTIALVPAGIIPYYSGLRTIDLVGLNDVRIAHTEAPEFGRGEPGHEKHNSAYVLERQPELIFLGACRISQRRLSAARLEAYHWAYGRLVPGNREMLKLDAFRRNYFPCAARIGQGYIHFYKRNGFIAPMAEPLT